MEQDPHMDHDQTNEPSGPHETHDEDETGQINDEEQPNNDEFETNESNEGAEAQAWLVCGGRRKKVTVWVVCHDRRCLSVVKPVLFRSVRSTVEKVEEENRRIKVCWRDESSVEIRSLEKKS
ncbi:hypothetical protein Tco_0462839 [Tanacetum coccineum]